MSKVPQFLTDMFNDPKIVEERIKELETLETSVYKTRELNFWYAQLKYLENK